MELDPPTVVWSMVASGALLLSAVHALAWWQSRQSWTDAVFALMAAGVAGMAGIELAMMRQPDPAAFGRMVRLGHIPGTVISLALPLYLRLRLGKRHTFLFFAATGSRVVVAALNFLAPLSIAWHEVRTLKPVPFLGTSVWVADEAVPNPLRWLASCSLLLLGAYIFAMWFGRDGRQAARGSPGIAAGFAIWMLIAIVTTILIHHDVISFPYLISLSTLPLLAAITLELSRETLRAAAFTRKIEEQSADIALAARVARIVHWNWDMRGNLLWSSGGGCGFHGLPGEENPRFDTFLEAIHPEDKPALLAAIDEARTSGWFHAEYRLRGDGPPEQTGWVLACGNVEFGPDGRPTRMRGVSMDISERKAAETEARARRDEVARLSRVGTLGEISGSLAHELNQPLSAILHNAEAAHRLLLRDPPAVGEAAEVCADVVSATLRAREVVRRLRVLLENGSPVFQPVAIGGLITETLDLLDTELRERGVHAGFHDPGVPPVHGDRIQLQQLFLNLILNAAEAMHDTPAEQRHLEIRASAAGDTLQLEFTDSGCGLPEDPSPLFEPFVTTKPHGLGMGLAVCRGIARAHSGAISAANAPSGGAVFRVILPIAPGTAPSPP